MAKNTNGAASKGNKGTSNKGFKPTACPITREQFIDDAAQMPIKIGDSGVLTADPREFSSGSLGWFANGKVTVIIDGVAVKCQFSGSLTVIGSKELPKDE
jgi:hypothetical protein